MCYEHVWVYGLGFVCFQSTERSDSDLLVSRKCANSIADDFVVFGNGIIARHGSSESDVCISMGCLNVMSDDIVVFVLIVFSLDSSRTRAIYALK